jgi:lipopolysaccharide/colanic/teichoic acid biosynthesis glycosyltransferase
MQRLLDLILSLLALLLFSPLLVPVGLLLRLTGEGEIFFLQNRIGKDGQIFSLYKFATMIKDSPNLSTGTVTTKNDPRILPIGQFLRKSKINELPQLINILMGDMSMVGPRPQTQRCFDAFSLKTKNAIVQVRPGLSGIGSIIFRDEEAMLHGQVDLVQFYDKEIAPYKGLLEEWYVENQGFLLYLLLIGLTVWIVIFPKSKLVWKVLPSLPKPPLSIKSYF